MGGAIAAGDVHTAEVGAEILARGGNAVDATVAACFAVFVAETLVANIGSGGFATVASTDGVSVYDFFSSMPTPPNRKVDLHQVMLDFGDEQQPFYIGRASTAIPGAVAGLCQMAQDHGSMPLSDLIAPAIKLARQGVRLLPNKAYILKLLEPIYCDTPECKALWTRNGEMLGEGDQIRMPRLAESLSLIAAQGAAPFYQGELADAIVTDHTAHGGLITHQDLATYQVAQSRPIHVTYRDADVVLPGLSSHGGVLIAFALKLLNTLPIADMEPSGYDHQRALAHVIRLAVEARASWSDMALRKETLERPHDVDLAGDFLSEARFARYTEKLRRALSGDVDINMAPEDKGPSSTTQVSVMDDAGMAVSLTMSAGEAAGYMVGETGMCLNNILGELDLNPMGFHKYPHGARLFSMMSPAIVTRNGRPILAVGSAGSNRIRSAMIQVISNVIDHGMSLDEAVNAPRLHFEDGVLQLEAGYRENVAQRLETEGFQVNRWRQTNLYFGGAQAVGLVDGAFAGGGDHRREGVWRVV